MNTPPIRAPKEDRPVITMTSLGVNGRFANQLFQYAFLKTYALRHDLRVETPPWIGNVLFGASDPLPSRPLQLVKQEGHDPDTDPVAAAAAPLRDVDLWGYFQYHTKYYAPFRDYIRRLFTPVPEISAALSPALERLRAHGRTVIGLHIRRGDFGYGYFFRSPVSWYIEWLNRMWESVEAPVLFIASDEPDAVLPEFRRFSPVTAAALGCSLPQAPYYPDFFLLSQCDIAAISNSSFSFAACMLNDTGRRFFRPSLPSRGLVAFDPWNSDTLLRDMSVDQASGIEGVTDPRMVRLTGSMQRLQAYPYREVNRPDPAAERVKFPDLKVLVSYRSMRHVLRDTMFSRDEFFCSPDCEPIEEKRGGRNLRTPMGVYDIQTVLDRLPSGWRPDILIVKADASQRNFPVNLSALDCPKVLIAGNTQHMNNPVRTLLEYARRERFDVVCSDHKRHHLHYFAEAGFRRVCWIPGINVNIFPQPDQPLWRYPLSFVGQAGRWHPYRRHMLDCLRGAGLPPLHFEVAQEKAAEIYGQSLITLNCSLNGDLNLRIFEVLSSGGFLLTDRLAPQAGMELLFTPGVHYDDFGSVRELVEKTKHYLAHPEKARAIARAGLERFNKACTPEKMVRTLIDYVLHDRIDPLYSITREPRSVHVVSESPAQLDGRVALYEWFQELQLNAFTSTVLLAAETDPRLACDLADLHRVKTVVRGNRAAVAPGHRALWEKTGILDRLSFTGELKQAVAAYDCIVAEAKSLRDPDTLFLAVPFLRIMVTDGISATVPEELDRQLRNAGLARTAPGKPVYEWADICRAGERLLKQGNPAAALFFFNIAKDRTPGDYRPWLQLGMLSRKAREFQAAEYFLRQALVKEPKNEMVRKNLAELYRETGHPAAALAILTST